MAGRIRSIKPEILEDERAAGLSSDAWRLWVSMWLLADDHGRLRGSETWLASQVFWSRKPSAALARLTEELAKARLIVRYTVEDQSYIEIRNWTKHQRVDHPSKPRIPASSDPLAKVSGTLARIPESLAPDLRSPTTDLDHRPPTTDRPAKAGALCVLASLNEARKKAIPGARAIGANPSSLEHIEARLADGYTVEDCEHVIAVCAAEVRQQPDTAKWFNTVSPFRKDNFARKLGGNPDSAGSTGHARNFGDIEEVGDMTHKLGNWSTPQ